MEKIRHPTAIGFYPADPVKLKRSIIGCIPPDTRKRENALGAVVPHAGYMYSGKTAGHVYAALPTAETYVILGPNHRGMGSPIAVSTETWQTPLGRVEVDHEFVDILPGNIIDRDEIAHKREHSIEVQLPFIQHTQKDFKIVPVCIGLQDEESALEIGSEIREAVKKSRKRVVVIASSDLTHSQPATTARKKDAQVIDAILNLNIDEIYTRIYELDATVCGYGAIAAMLYAVKSLGASRAELLHYSTSGDVTGDNSSVVGYAGIIVE
ncbi:hypothetical protein B6V01_002400 [Methanosarcinales archaeon ex4572_44]|nr:MAG: AmmeMemoRadiSam system protein B [Methanosarcinales archaeon ex4484_138]PHP45771.1 MAG: hypothetical protein B6V01_002400 [Methanosarcinales archaeon ex4572_44]RLG25564.1 MAG: hypothetical protein DRN85_05570 [Methanosarcinales archaeon]